MVKEEGQGTKGEDGQGREKGEEGKGWEKGSQRWENGRVKDEKKGRVNGGSKGECQGWDKGEEGHGEGVVVGNV